MPSNPRDAERLGILFALPEEAAPFRKRQAADSVPFACSGVGWQNARLAAARLIESASPPLTSLLLCGFAGGLNAETSPGDLVIAAEVLDGTDPTCKRTYTTDSRLLATAESVRVSGLSIHVGTLLTTSRVLTTAAEKRLLLPESGACAVDMETAGAAQTAQEHGLPWLAVRAITDGVDDDLPLDFNALADADGSVNRRRVVQAVLSHPRKIPALVRLGARSALAARNLAAFLEAFLEKQR